MIPEFRENVDNSSKTPVRCWVYGGAYSGKTTLGDTFPKPLFINTDGNIKNIKHPVLSISDKTVKEGRILKTTYLFDEFKDIIAELQSGTHGYESLIIDLLDDVYESGRKSICNKNGWSHESDDSFKAYDIVRNDFLGVIKQLSGLPLNIMYISHEDTSKDITKRSGDKVTSIQPKIPEKLTSKICGMVDFTARMDADHNLIFNDGSNMVGGNRINVSIDKIENPTYEKIKELYK